MKLSLFLFAALISCSASAQKPTLIGGTPVKPGEYPEVVYISFNSGRCSAAVVGPKVILTAAHCARGGAKITYQIGQTQYTAFCEAPSVYPRQDHDVSLCIADKVMPEPYATISKEGPKVNDTVTLIGYGCVRPGGGGGNDGVLRVGESVVTGFTPWDFITKSKTALCFGDSGGPAFKQIKDAKNEHHYIIGVNSKGNIKNTSYLSMVYSDASQKFFYDWAVKNTVNICGVNKVCDEKPVCQTEWADLKKAHNDFDLDFETLNSCFEKDNFEACKLKLTAARDKNLVIDEAFSKLISCFDSL